MAPKLVAAEDERPDSQVSYYREVKPIFKRSCNGCHHPGKKKAELDLSTYAAIQSGSENGPVIISGDPDKSMLIEEIAGEEPSMPEEGDPLTQEEVALIARWIQQGAKNDTPEGVTESFELEALPVYTSAPLITALSYSPSGDVLAVAAYHEVVLHKSDGTGLISRLFGRSPRIESLCFSPDGKRLVMSGGAPARFGEVQIWDLSHRSAGKQIQSFAIENDTVFGASFSPDGERVAFGGADKAVRIIRAVDGKELMKFDNHSDWVFSTLFTVNGNRLVSGSRDRAMKLIDASTAQFIDDINKLLEGVICMARHPTEDKVAYGGELGTTRLYNISDNQGRTAANNDVNLIRQFERLTGPVHAVAFSSDGKYLAAGGVHDEVRVWNTGDGSRAATLKGHVGPIFALAFHPVSGQLATAGFDGKVRIYEIPSGNELVHFVPVPIEPKKDLAKGVE